MIKNLLFDLGGVFIEHTRAVCVERFEQFGVHDADNLLDPYRQSGLFLDLERGVHSEQSFAEELNKTYGLSLAPEQVRFAIHGFVHKIEDYKFDFIEQKLPKELRLLLVSNTNPYIWGMSQRGELLQNGRSFDSYFEKSYASFEMKLCKPEREIFERIIEDAQIKPEETLFIDDGPANTEMGRSLGFVTYCPDNGEDWRPVLEKMLIK